MNIVLKTLPPPQTTNHRQNRRRERPGARTRRTLSRKNAILYDCTEGLFDARDSSVLLPSDRSRPSPLLRQSFDQSWARWKAREAEAAAAAAAAKAQAHLKEMDMLQQEQQRLRALFGGDELDDDELRRLGILHDGEDTETNSVAEDLPPYPSAAPAFIIRPGKPSRKRALKCSTWRSLSLYLSFSELSGDDDIARLLTSEHDNTLASIVSSTIQHREIGHSPLSISSSHFDSADTPSLSLPTPELASAESPVIESVITTPVPHDIDSSSLPALSIPRTNTASEDWAFIQTPTSSITSSEVEADASNPDILETETWVLLDDDS